VNSLNHLCELMHLLALLSCGNFSQRLWTSELEKCGTKSHR